MPICPRCNATIHAGAREQCPACGYSLTAQESLFGSTDVVFPRVKDVAGVLTQQERESLMRYLANLERYIPPVALCIYLTNHGQSKEFRAHAHWILNHAHIHTPSFGKREGQRAIEDAELRMESPEEKRARTESMMREEGALTRFWHWLKESYQARFSKCPPPVRHEWMLILVLDVQLKMACFSWGYMLDPYINPDKINSCITSARLQFRERARVSALQIVMKKAAKQLASAARRVNKDIQRGKRIISPVLAALFGFSLFSATPVCWAAKPAASSKPAAAAKTASKPAAKPAAKTASKPAAKPVTKPASKPAAKPASKPAAKPAAKPTPKPVMEDDMVAVDDAAEDEDVVAIDDEAVAGDAMTPQPVPASPQQPLTSASGGSPASYASAPVWHKEDHARLMVGELTACYRTLLPEGKVNTPSAQGKAKNKGNESDERVLRHYCQDYNRASAAGLCDPQGLLSDMERSDVEHVLGELNTNAPFRLYVAVFKAGQEIPQELNATTLVTETSQPDEHAAMILYSIGDTPDVRIGYREITPTDEQRREWLLQTQIAAAQAGGGVEGLLASLHCLRQQILPVSKDFKPLDVRVGRKLPLVPLEFEKSDEAKEPSMRDKLKAWMADPENKSAFVTGGIGFVCAVGIGLLLFMRRRVVRLLDSTPDVRLASPHGAGVSRYVRYLDGKEAAKDTPLY